MHSSAITPGRQSTRDAGIHFATHNAFNNWADDYPIPNQYWSLSDQLRLGSRHFQLDIHWFAGQLRLCHATEDHVGCSPNDRLYAYGIKEIRDWLASNPGQIVTMDFEDRSDQHTEDLENPHDAYFGDDLYKPLAYRQLGRLPTPPGMAGPHVGAVPAARTGRVLVIDPYDEHSGRLLLGNHVFSQKSGLITNPDSGDPNHAFNPVAQDCRTGVSTWGDNGPGAKSGPDYEITGPLRVQLRSERLGSGEGRIYRLTVRCSDASGNGSEKAVDVTVPHDQR